MKEFFKKNVYFTIDLQNFNNNEEKTNEEKGKEEKKNEEKGKEEQSNEESITLTKKQLEERLERERKKTKKELEEILKSNQSEEIKSAITKAIEEERTFAKMTEKEREEAKLRIEREKLEEEKKQLLEEQNKIKLIRDENLIKDRYIQDKLPFPDKFNVIAKVLATCNEDDKIAVYDTLKEIITESKAEAIKEQFKQKSPRVSSDESYSFKSEKFVKNKNKQLEKNRQEKWGK